MGGIWILLLALVLAGVYVVDQKCRPRLDEREPPLVPAKCYGLPHILGLISQGPVYYAKLRKAKPGPALTASIFGKKLYCVNSASLLNAMQRNHKIISFDPLLDVVADRMAGLSPRALLACKDEKDGGGGVNRTTMHAMHAALMGPELNLIGIKALLNVKHSVDALKDAGPECSDLFAWCRHAITVATTEAFYGPQNPYKAQIVEDSFWKYESNIGSLLAGFFPRLTARAALSSRANFVAAFIKYYEGGGQLESSELTKSRWMTQTAGGFTIEDVARAELVAGLGYLANSVPTTFWFLFEVYSRPDLLEQLREEILEKATRLDGNAQIIDIAKLRAECPLLMAVYHETIRLRSNGTAARVVLDDIVLNDELLLKAGSFVQVPASSINQEEKSWGSDASDFKPSRYLKTDSDAAPRHRSKGFLSFGMAPHLCPGRQFATGEIIGLASMLIMRYDMVTPDGKWIAPKLNSGSIVTAITPPSTPLPVRITQRKGEQSAEWRFELSEGKTRFNLMSG